MSWSTAQSHWLATLESASGLDDETNLNLKRLLHRIAAMVTRLISRLNVVAEPQSSYSTGIEYEHEYRGAEYEYDQGKRPESGR
jgi:hypothetical protein